MCKFSGFDLFSEIYSRFGHIGQDFWHILDATHVAKIDDQG